jgi:oxepin-CoA hydrolase/3-oxo-5,6-dehydrosuberyl-CoA semialdehyde dehydrogenase
LANSGCAAQVQEDRVHPFRKYFEELQPGDSLLTPRRTLTEADIVNFACLSGDHFYAHMDKIGAAESIFGERVVHGYFLISAAAGCLLMRASGRLLPTTAWKTCALSSRLNRAIPFRCA